ncbi:unnamed protein product [Calicophoron daubneyi]|uniref:BMERB domain-containing protein n=1 Tax=Calicophoron daubneyi TaxID=300641 RepID=A0AAV2TKQ6_CALDB
MGEMCECCLSAVVPSERIVVSEKVYHYRCYSNSTRGQSSSKDLSSRIDKDLTLPDISSLEISLRSSNSPSPVRTLVRSPYAVPTMKPSKSRPTSSPPPRPPPPALSKVRSPEPRTPFDSDVFYVHPCVPRPRKPSTKTKGTQSVVCSNTPDYPDSLNPFPSNESEETLKVAGTNLGGLNGGSTVHDNALIITAKQAHEEKKVVQAISVQTSKGSPVNCSTDVPAHDFSSECHTLPLRRHHMRLPPQSPGTMRSLRLRSEDLGFQPVMCTASSNFSLCDTFGSVLTSIATPVPQKPVRRSSSVSYPTRHFIASRSPNVETKSAIIKRPAPPLPVPNKRAIKADPSEPFVDYSRLHERLFAINARLHELEQSARKMQACIKEASKSRADVSRLLDQWSRFAEMKDALFREESAILQQLRRQELEERHSNLEHELRVLLAKQDCLKSDEERALESELISELIATVDRRAELQQETEQLANGDMQQADTPKTRKSRAIRYLNSLRRSRRPKQNELSKKFSILLSKTSKRRDGHSSPPGFCIGRQNTID